MAPVERYFQSFDATNSLQSTVLRMKCGVNIWFFANSKSVYYLRTPPFPTSEIVSNEIELIHDVNQHSTLGNNMTSPSYHEIIVGIYSYENLLFIATTGVIESVQKSFYLSIYCVSETSFGSSKIAFPHLQEKQKISLDHQPIDLIVIQMLDVPPTLSTGHQDVNISTNDFDSFIGEAKNFVVISTVESPYILVYELNIFDHKLYVNQKYFDYYLNFIRKVLQCEITNSTPLRLECTKKYEDKPSVIMAGFKNGCFNWSYLSKSSNQFSNISSDGVDISEDYMSYAEIPMNIMASVSLQTISEGDDSGLSDASSLHEEKALEQDDERRLQDKPVEMSSPECYLRSLIQSCGYVSCQMDGAITAMAPYSLLSEAPIEVQHPQKMLASLAVQMDFTIAIGLECGTVALLSPREDQLKNLHRPCSCGSAHSIAVGNITKSNVNDVIVGFEDGTVVIYRIDFVDCMDAASVSIATSLEVCELWRSKLPFAVLCVEFGQLLYGNKDLVDSQIAVLTSNSVHLFVFDDSLYDNDTTI